MDLGSNTKHMLNPLTTRICMHTGQQCVGWALLSGDSMMKWLERKESASWAVMCDRRYQRTGAGSTIIDSHLLTSTQGSGSCAQQIWVSEAWRCVGSSPQCVCVHDRHLGFFFFFPPKATVWTLYASLCLYPHYLIPRGAAPATQVVLCREESVRSGSEQVT